MRRRDFILGLGGAGTWPVLARAQQPGKTRRIGVLLALAEDDRQAQARLAMFRGELQRLGWTDITIDARFAAAVETEKRQRYALELVALQPDLILSQTTDTTRSLLQQTRTIPIIFAVVFDPVAEGFAASVARPGGNTTGFITGEPSMGGKWLELLKEVAPDVKRVLVPFNTATSTAEYYLRSLRDTAAQLGMDARATFVRDTAELEAAIAEHARMPDGGLVSIPDSFMTQHYLELTSLAARYRLPAVYANLRLFADNGGLLSYGSDALDNFRRAAIYADRVLKGAKPGELPVQAPEKFELVINLKAAKALGLTVSPTLLGRANEVIE